MGEALSWKGYDIALLKLSKKYHGQADLPSPVLPICLAEKGFPERDEEAGPSFMAGFGRREIAHCITNEMGPEAYEVCARPTMCTTNHRFLNLNLLNLKKNTYSECNK